MPELAPDGAFIMMKIRVARVLLLAAAAAITAGGVARGATPPAGFEDLLVAPPGVDPGVLAPTAIAFHPLTGDLWITEKGDGQAAGTARVRVLKDGSVYTTAITIPCLDSRGERGLLDLVFDPAFETNRFVYVFATRRRDAAAGCPQPAEAGSLNVVSRFTEAGGALQAETILLEGPMLLAASELHNGGTIRFLPDGTLLVSMGDNAVNVGLDPISQRLDDLRGKILRIRRDGTIPGDNPFAGVAGARPEIWALGFRNPFRFSVHPVTGAVLLSDVGEAQWEEVDLGMPGANYGWPCFEANTPFIACPPAPPESWTFPVFAYHHGTLTPPVSGSAIITGPVYTGTAFPASYHGTWFFADYARRWIRRASLAQDGLPRDVEMFLTGATGPVDLEVGPDGCLYYAAILSSEVRRVCYVGGSNGQPTAVAAVAPRSGQPPLEVYVNASESTDPDGDGLAFTWRFGDGGVSPQARTSHIYTSAGVYEASLLVNDRRAEPNSTDSSPPALIVVGNDAPAISLHQPADGARYDAGQTITFSGQAVDPQDGQLAAAALTWTVVFHHADHVHPFLGPIAGVAAGSFTIPAQGEGDPNVAYEIVMSATDSGAPIGGAGRVTTTTRAVLSPNVSTLSVAADPAGAGLSLGVDGVPHAAPHALASVVGWPRILSAPAEQTTAGRTFRFDAWSDGGAASHTVTTPAGDATYTARYTCPAIDVIQDLDVGSPVNGWIPLSWQPSADLCLEDRPFQPRYAVYRAATARPESPPGNFPLDPAFSLVAVTQGSSLMVLPASPFEAYLVVAIGRDGTHGPSGHY